MADPDLDLNAPPWRERVPPHPAADLFPLLSNDELKELADDIEQVGLLNPIVLTVDGKQVVDGRSRLDALEERGTPIFKLDGSLAVPHIRLEPGDDPYLRVISLNILRRHLKAADKRALIKKVMAANPALSDRQIAKVTKTSHPTVAKVRRTEAKANGKDFHKPERVEASGRKARGRKPAAPSSGILPEFRVTTKKVRFEKGADGKTRYSVVEPDEPDPEPPHASTATFIFTGDLDQFARTIVKDLTPQQAEAFLEAVRRWVEVKRRAVDDVGPAVGLH